MGIQFGLRLPACRPVSEVAEAAAVAERVGFDEIWVPDCALLWREVWVTLSAIALKTSKPRLGPCITTPVTRHPSVTAGAITSLDELSGGRAILGLGPGDASVSMVERSPARVQTMREAIQTIRSLSQGEWVQYGKRKVRMKSAESREGPIPIYMAASGPRMLELAGEVADGVILLAGIAAHNLDYALNHVRAGARRVGRGLEDLEVILGVHCYVGEDWRRAQKQARPFCAFFATHAPEALRAVGIPVPEPGPMPELYPDATHAEDWEKAVALTDWIPDETLKQFCAQYTLMGDGKEIVRKLEGVVSRGINHFFLLGFSSYELPMPIAETFAKTVFPHFKNV